MRQELWQKVEDLFHAALEHPPESRRAFLDGACEGDTGLREQIELLLSMERRAGSFLETPIIEQMTETMLAAESLLGRQIGPYRVISRLGAGGMGEVYRAHDEKLGRDVAVKTLPYEFARDSDRLARFRHEARTLASLNHPNIAAIYGVEQSGEVDCLVLELVEGENLHGPLPIASALDYADQVAEALEAAHAKGIIHRDLKSANIKVTPAGKVKLLDFGLAKAISAPEESKDLSQLTTVTRAASVTGQMVGTPGYMSPEQARGKAVDNRTDIWAFGCVLYELLTGKRAFAGETLPDTIAAVLDGEPDWQALPANTPGAIRELLRQCLQKDVTLRLNNIANARRTIEEVQRGSNRWRAVAVAVTALAMFIVAVALWLRGPVHPNDRSQWVQLTKFPDSVTEPALSPDGRMMAFINGPSTFVGPGQIYVKVLPNGKPIQLTHDNTPKMDPVFSPDGSRVAYTTYMDGEFGWDTWIVPVLGGEPQVWLKNASGLVWVGPQRVLFSEIKTGIHMGIVTSDESRKGERDVYLPAAEPSMAHRSYPSPDGKWVLLVEMDEDHLWLPCRLVPLDGSSSGKTVGPSGGGCTSAAWTPDGKWMYLTSNAVDSNHIWRQRFPDGRPEQITFGPTEEEGIAIAPDGRSFVTSVALQNASLWVLDAKDGRRSERRISVEGNTANPKFTPDGKKLLYRIVREPPSESEFYRDLGEIMVADLGSGRSEPLAPGFQALDYDISADGRQVAMQTADSQGKSRIWLAPLNRSSPPRQIPNIEGGAPRFGPNGEILFRHTEGNPRMEGSVGLVYRVRTDGTGLQRAIAYPILLAGGVSPDGKWLVAWAPLPGNGPPATQAFPLDGGTPLTIGSSISFEWSPDGNSLSISSSFSAPIPEGRSYVVPLRNGKSLPQIPAGGFHTEQEVASLPGARKIDVAAVISDVAGNVVPGPSPEVYAFYRGSVQRNLYRIPISY